MTDKEIRLTKINGYCTPSHMCIVLVCIKYNTMDMQPFLEQLYMYCICTDILFYHFYLYMGKVSCID